MKRKLTVQALIARLQDQPPDAEVYVEGCDCVEPATDVTPSDDKKAVYIRQEYGAIVWEPDTQSRAQDIAKER